MSSIRERMKARKQQVRELIASTSSASIASQSATSAEAPEAIDETLAHAQDVVIKPEPQTDDPPGPSTRTSTSNSDLRTSNNLTGTDNVACATTVPEELPVPDEVPDSTSRTGGGIPKEDDTSVEPEATTSPDAPAADAKAAASGKARINVEDLLAAPSAREKESRKLTTEILDLLNKPTAKELALQEKFKSDGSSMQEFCKNGTKEDCARISGGGRCCGRLHFKKIIQKHTDVSLGDCSFLNTCFHMDACKYIHYEVDYSTSKDPTSSHSDTRERKRKRTSSGGDAASQHSGTSGVMHTAPSVQRMYPPQWIQCDLRFFSLPVLGKCAVVMADPPWDIHMELPYGTMSDDEMRCLNVQALQDEGLIFLWVTGRAMELGRECLQLWGYRQVDEIIWVKTNQLQRIIRTGRTGHWLNHGKEHCLVGVKGALSKYHVGLDCDVIVAEVRATSHKPDEIYGLIERMSPGTRKVELFGRQHNVQPNWITLGNQLDGVRLVDPDVVDRFQEKYPDGNCMPKRDEVIRYKQQKELQQQRPKAPFGARNGMAGRWNR